MSFDIEATFTPRTPTTIEIEIDGTATKIIARDKNGVAMPLYPEAMSIDMDAEGGTVVLAFNALDVQMRLVGKTDSAAAQQAIDETLKEAGIIPDPVEEPKQ